MQIAFGYQLDRVSWSDQESCLGAVRTGPEGMLSILENRCGVATKSVDHTARVAGIYALLERMDNDDAWFHDSFQVDPWATAQELLLLADELCEGRIAHGGLSKGSGDGPESAREATSRIAGMTAIAAEAELLAGGVPDRFARVLRELRQPPERRFANVADLQIDVDLPYACLTPIWQAIFDTLAACGTVVSYADAEIELRNRPRITLLRTADEWEAAEYVATRLSATYGNPGPIGTAHPHPELCMLVESDATALDLTLQKRGVPLTGATRSSSARWELQLLPAFISTFWNPVNPQAIAEFLSLASGVVRKDVASAIVQALQEHPGVGGPTWHDAMETIRTAVGEKEADRLDRFFSRELFDEQSGIPMAALSERLGWLRRRVAIRLESSELAATAIAQTEQLEGALDRVFGGSDAKAYRTFLERLLGTVVSPVALGEEEQAAPWRVYRNLQSVPPDERLLLWWNAVDSQESTVTRFTSAEIEVLAKLGFAMEETARRRRRHRYYARKFLAHGPDELLLLLPDRLRGEPVEPHPLVEELRSLSPQRVSEIDTRLSPAAVSLLGRSIETETVQPELAEPTPSAITVAPASVGYPKRLSYSAIRSLLGCPMQWSLKEQVRLGRTYGVSLPTGNQMLGTLTHKIVELLATEHLEEGALPDRTERLAGELFDRLVPEMAAELALPGKHLLRQRYRTTVVRAVGALRDLIRNMELSIREVERFLKATWELSVGEERLAIELVGPADMELVDAEGRPFVLDLKFSYGPNSYVEAVKNGEAIQLATYAYLIEQNRGTPPLGTGYFLLPIRRLVTASELAGSEAIQSERPTGEVWKRTGRSVATALEALRRKGEIAVTGLLENEEGFDQESRRATAEAAGEIYQAPPCKFCDFALVCGLKRGGV